MFECKLFVILLVNIRSVSHRIDIYFFEYLKKISLLLNIIKEQRVYKYMRRVTYTDILYVTNIMYFIDNGFVSVFPLTFSMRENLHIQFKFKYVISKHKY